MLQEPTPNRDVDGKPNVAHLVGYPLANIVVHGARGGAARLQFVPHVNCRVAGLPVKRIVGGRLVVDFVLPHGHVPHDYLV